MRITIRPMSKERERRFSHSPTYKFQIEKDGIHEKENENPQVIAPSLLTSEDWIQAAEREREKETKKRKPRQSLGRRVSFSQTVDVRQFYKNDEGNSPPHTTSELAPATPPPMSLSDLIDFQSPAPVPLENLLSSFENGTTPTELKTPSLSRLLESFGDDTTQAVQRELRTPRLENLLDFDYDQTLSNIAQESTDMNITAMNLTGIYNSQASDHKSTNEDEETLESGSVRSAEFSKFMKMVESYAQDESNTGDFTAAIENLPPVKPPRKRRESDMHIDGNTLNITSTIPSFKRLAVGEEEDEKENSTRSLGQILAESEDTQDITDRIITKILKTAEPSSQPENGVLTCSSPDMKPMETDSENITMSAPSLETLAQEETAEILSKSKGPISFEDFLYLSEIRFLDDLSTYRRPSISPFVSNTVKSTNETLELACLLLPEFELKEWGCSHLKGLISDINAQTREVETLISQNNPKIFDSIRTAQDPAALKDALKKLRKKCQKQAKESWYEWRVKLAQNMTNRFTENLELLNTDKDRIHGYLENLSKLLQSIKSDKFKLVTERNQKEHEYTNEFTRLSLSGPAPSTPGKETATADELEQTIESQVELLKILSGISLWKVKALNPNELIIRFNEQYMIHMMLGGLDGEVRTVGQKTFGVVPGVQLDELTSSLTQAANITGILNNLTVTAQLSEVLGDISFRLGRVIGLRKELTKLERVYTIRYKRRESGVMFAEIEISNSSTWSKFLVGVDLDFGYPFSQLSVSFKNFFGNVTQSQVEQTIERVPSGFGRLTKICTALKNI